MATLHINNRKEFDEAVFQTSTEFDTARYNEWRKTASEALQRIYTKIEDMDGIDTEDFYTLGDVLNLLCHITIDAEHTAETWTVSKDDFNRYDLSHLTDKEVNALIDRAAHIAQNDGMGEHFNEAIRLAALGYDLRTVYSKCRDANAIYLYLRKTHPNEDYGKMFLETKVTDKDLRKFKSKLSGKELRIAGIMASYEECMHQHGEHWNDDGFNDYESAMEQLITLVTEHPSAHISWENGVPSIVK